MEPTAPTPTRLCLAAGGETIRIGVDDTDSPAGGCTTFALTEIVRVGQASGFDVVGYPRLVRLDPNVPTKTRGNAALAVEFGHGRGPSHPLGRIGSEAVVGYSAGEALRPSERAELVERAWDAVCIQARWDGVHTEPAICWTEQALPNALYSSAVSRWTDVEVARRALQKSGGEARWARSPQGLVGAASACAWPAERTTFELIAYRQPARVGTRRSVDARSVGAAQLRYPELFLCHDPLTRRLLVAPHSNCPVLYGLRATAPGRLPDAREMIRSEPTDRWMLFQTNQATGDHLARRSLAELRPYDAARVIGTVSGAPETLPGGHVRVRIRERAGVEREAYCFEPSKTLPRVASALVPGDRVALWVGASGDLALRVEGLELLNLAPRWAVPRTPRCPDCQRRAHSLGGGRGFRCLRCHHRWPPEAIQRSRTRPPFPTGVYHPTPSARRHLAPLGPEPAVRPMP